MTTKARLDAIRLLVLAAYLTLPVTIVAASPAPDVSSAQTTCPIRIDTRSFRWNDDERRYRIALPRCSLSLPLQRLVVVLHAGGSDARAMASHSKLDGLAADGKTGVVYPQGSSRVPGLKTWNAGHCCGNAMLRQVDDAGYVRALMASLRDQHALTPDAVYLTGMSNGAMLAYRIAAETPDVLAGVVGVSGTATTMPDASAKRLRILHVHGSEDQHIPWSGGTGQHTLSGTEHASVSDTLQPWINVLQASQPVEVVRHPEWDDRKVQVTSYRYRDAEQVVRVELIGIQGGGHVWPGQSHASSVLGETSAKMDMVAIIRDFMERRTTTSSLPTSAGVPTGSATP